MTHASGCERETCSYSATALIAPASSTPRAWRRYTTPVGLASVLTSRAAQTASELEGTFGWVQPAGGAFLVAFGSYNVLIAGFGPV